jgi:RNA polymerase sigma factor (sigma-70 family)
MTALVRFPEIMHILSVMKHDGEKLIVSDAELLRRFAREGKQAAFAELVTRYSGLVYSTCLRDVHNSVVAEDAAQAVFLLLARKASALRVENSLAGWLYQTARLVSRNAARQEACVRLREQRIGQRMADLEAQRTENDLWSQIEPVLNAALDSLGRQDREAVLLRFLDGRSLKETGTALGLSEDAARMRVSRSLEKLRRFLAKEGVVLPAALLAGLLTEKVTQAAPASIQLGISGAGAAAPRAYQLAQGASKTMWITKAIIVAGLIGTGAGGIAGIRHLPLRQAAAPASATSIRPPLAASTEAAAMSPQDIISQAAAATGRLHSLQGSLTLTLSSQGKSSTVTGLVAVQRPNLAHTDFHSASNGGSRMIADGNFQWSFSDGSQKYYKELDAPDGRDMSQDTSDVFANFFFNSSLAGLSVEPDSDEAAVRSLGEQIWHGGRYQVIELKRKALIKNTILAFFGPDHLLRRVVVTTFFDDGTIHTEEAFLSNMKTDIPLDKRLFTFTVPNNAVLVDTAKVQLELMGRLKQIQQKRE